MLIIITKENKKENKEKQRKTMDNNTKILGSL